MKVSLLAIFLTFLQPVANANDYGIGHGLITHFFHKGAGSVNKFLFDDERFSNDLTGIETGLLALWYCNRERKARGTWNISKWDDLSGSYDSAFDCLFPLGVTGERIYFTYTGKPAFALINLQW